MPLEEIWGWAASTYPDALLYPLPQERAQRCQEPQKGPATLVHTLVRHQSISEFMAPHVSSNIWSLGCTQPGVGVGVERAGVPAQEAPPNPRQP